MEATWKSHVTLGNQKLENREGCTFRKTIKTVNRCRRKLLLLPQKPNSLSRLEEKKYTEKNQTLLSLSLYIYIYLLKHMPKLKYIGSVRAVWDVIGEAYCQRCATVRGSDDVKVSLIPAMWGTGADLRGVADGHDRVGFTARYWRYQPHASVLHH
jgi:hypothetical protein